MNRFTSMAIGASLVAAFGSPQSSLAATPPSFKSAPIKIVVAFSAGGPGDLLARRIGQQLSQDLGTPVVIENKTGAGGQIATSTVVTAKPDGYTLLLNTGALSTEAVTKNKLPYDVLKDLAPVTKAVDLPAVVMVSNRVPAKTMKDFVQHAKANPDKITFGSSGISSSTHLAGELMKSVTGIEAVHVPYAGGTPMLQALMTGEIAYLVAPISMSKPLAESGKVHPLAVSASQRVAYWPEVVTTAESGYPEVDFTLWFGFFAPAKTPSETVSALNRAIVAAAQQPTVARWITDQGFLPINNSPEQFKSEIASEIKRWEALVKRLNLPKSD
ncbi:Bug family tripartite tricarboxylate transporter substrate binding protein [Variovorax sp. LT1R16]|uniref:Bug family tripartite tricarboxylate transporter substrate binding protein n=1 Tax=Variovorax sp. LT1R16 TaxID=3443728 RepID=UPI003F48E8AB